MDPDFSNREEGHTSLLTLPSTFSHMTRESIVVSAGSSSAPRATALKGIGSVTSVYPDRVSLSSKYLRNLQERGTARKEMGTRGRGRWDFA